MKKGLLALILCLTLTLSLTGTVWAAGGDQADPVVSLSYLENIWRYEILKEVSALMEEPLRAARSAALKQLGEDVGAARMQAEQYHTGVRQHLGKLFLKQGDILNLQAGAKIIVLSGTLSTSASLANVTLGEAVDPAVTPVLSLNQTYMEKQNFAQGLTVSSVTAELWIDGSFDVTCSGAVDYGSLAMALNEMGLFRGMTGGFMLDGTTTRAQGLVMFLRLMGLEDEALRCTDKIPFKDISGDHWARPYIAYAYKLGLTTGTSQTAFSPNAPVTAQHYLTFLMRALEYKEGSQFSYNTVLKDAQTQGLFSQTEISLLSQDSLHRYKMVYLSYYALFCDHQTRGGLLLEMLLEDGTVTEDTMIRGLAQVKSPRLP